MQYTDIVVFLLVFVRIISFLGSSPIFMIKGIPSLMKIGLGLLLSYLIFGFVSYDPSHLPATLLGLAGAAVGESIFGLAMGFATTLVFQAIRMSGQLMDIQVGFSMSTEFDITGSSNTTILGNLTYLLGLLIFFLVDGHHVLIQSLLQSFDVIPLLGVNIPPEIGMFMLNLFANTFIIAIKLAAPIVIVLFLSDFTLGLIARTVPQLNIFMMGLPIKVLLGLLALTALLPGLVQIYIKAFQGIPVDINNLLKIFPLAIAFAASDKTEEATPKKKEEARKKGQVAKSREFVSAVTLLGFTLIAVAAGSFTLQTMETYLSRSLSNAGSLIMGEGDVINLLTSSVIEFIKMTLPLFVGVMVLGVIANLVQTGFIHSSEALKPKFSRLNPIEGFKRMFSGKAFVEMIKALANITIVGYVAYSFVSGEIFKILKLSDTGITTLLSVPGDIIQSELMRVAIVVCVIGIIDLVYQKRAYRKELRMTKQEVKEEYKQTEGDPKIKSAIRQRQRQMAARRMMHEVPKATVVITNPTHLAVAVRYDKSRDGAPVVVAKGADDIARRIKQVAKDNKVPVIENKPVARMLYERVEIDEAIPVEMYQAVAEILAMVYTLKKKIS